MKKAATAARAVAAAAVLLMGSLAPALAQEQQLVEEIVARVNADVITRTQYLEVLKQTEDDIKQQTPDAAEAQKRFEEFKPKILDIMIDNLLIIQKGQDLSIDVEADVNRQFTEMAKGENKSVTEFEELMRQNGLDPNDIRSRLRERLMRDRVMNQEVYGAIWRGLTEKEKREYYEAHSDKFMQEGELKLSELFLPVEGRSFTEIETKGREIVASARSGASFTDLVKKFGDPTRASYANGGSLGSFKSTKDLAAPFSTAIENLKQGEVTDPIRLKDGVIILHVDERREAAAKPFEAVSNDVALTMVYDRSQEAEQKYLQKIRSEAHIKIPPGYETASAKSAAPAPAGDKP
jgi:peptidyl-prolyl cis-trans isomerase SurA